MSQADARKNFIKDNPGMQIVGRKGRWYYCAQCGKLCGRISGDKAVIPDDEKMEVDHILPWSQGGSDESSNLQPLCRPCNRNKSNNVNTADGIKIVANAIQNPTEALIAAPIRKALRSNSVLKGLGITKRK